MKIALLTPEYPHRKQVFQAVLIRVLKNLAKGLFGRRLPSAGIGFTDKLRIAFFDDNGICIQQIRKKSKVCRGILRGKKK
jgi:hypothetical protein